MKRKPTTIGRPPKGERTMTPAEKQKAYRERKKAANERQAYFTISGTLVDDLSDIAKLFEVSRTEAVSGILNSALKGLLPILNNAANDVQKLMKEHGGDSLPEKERTELERGLKREYWQFLLKKFEGQQQ